MTEIDLLNLARSVLSTALIVSAPILISVAAVGLVVSLIQALTQVQEQSLSFVPKLMAGVGICLFLGSWMLGVLVNLATNFLGLLGQPS